MRALWHVLEFILEVILGAMLAGCGGDMSPAPDAGAGDGGREACELTGGRCPPGASCACLVFDPQTCFRCPMPIADAD